MNNLNNHSPSQAQEPGFFRRFAAMFYDWVLLVAVILVAVTVFTLSVDLLFGSNTASDALQNPWIKLAYQIYLLIVAGLFYTWFWTHGGQTLGLKVWKLKIIDENSNEVSFYRAALRLLFAVISCAPLGLGFFWMLFNRRKMTLYDIWSKTRLVVTDAQAVSSTGG